MAKPRKVDGAWSYAYWAWVDDHGSAEAAARSAALAAIKRAIADGREPVQIEVTVRLAPKET